MSPSRFLNLEGLFTGENIGRDLRRIGYTGGYIKFSLAAPHKFSLIFLFEMATFLEQHRDLLGGKHQHILEE
jgi:hypothetical protein